MPWLTYVVHSSTAGNNAKLDDNSTCYSTRIHKNVGFSSANGAAYIKHHRNRRQHISKTMQRVKLYWGLSGCMPGKQHVRLCTPHALQKEEDLQCRHCRWLHQYQQGQDSAVMPGCERLIAEAFYHLNMTSSLCHQVAVKWWSGLISFT